MTGFAVSHTPAPDAFLAALRRNFDGWGTEDDFAWWFHRQIGGPAADLFVFEDGETLAAGSAVSYRRRLGGDELIAVMTGSWTDTAYRRRGLFVATIEESRAIAAERGACALLAFASADRASVRSLAAVSEVVHDAWLLDARDAVAAKPAAAPPAVEDLETWFHEHRLGAGFAYRGPVFREQLRLDDPQTSVRDLGDGYWAICRNGSVLAAVSAAPLVAEELGARVEACGCRAYTTIATVAHASSMPTRPALVFVIAVGATVPDFLRSTLDFHAVDRA